MTGKRKSFRLVSSREIDLAKHPNGRKCLACGYLGPMGTWCGTSILPNILVLAGLCFWLVPGLIFLAYAWGKPQCPSCKALNKSRPATAEEAEPGRKCPHCAETIKTEAKICRHCQRELPQPA